MERRTIEVEGATGTVDEQTKKTLDVVVTGETTAEQIENQFTAQLNSQQAFKQLKKRPKTMQMS